MKGIAPGLGQNINRSAGVASVFCPGAEGHDPDFLNRVVIDCDQRSEGSTSGIRGVDAVHQEDILHARAAVSCRTGEPGAGTGDIEHSWSSQGQVVERIACGRQFVQHIFFEPGINSRGLEVDNGAGGDDRHLFLDCANLHDHSDLNRAACSKDDVFLHICLETG